MRQSAIEWYHNEMESLRVNSEINNMDGDLFLKRKAEILERAYKMEKDQIFKFLKGIINQSVKEAYKAGQKTMNCGCYEIRDALTYEEWIYERFNSEE
jgi:hypothetical protein